MRKIVICGSMAFTKDMVKIKKVLEKRGFKCVLPGGYKDYLIDSLWQKRATGWGTLEGAKKKVKLDLIRKYYREIQESDAILVINFDKNNIKNYIGGNGFLEMGYAHVLNKKIYLLNPIPKELKIFYQEIVAMQPKIIKGDLDLIV